MYKGRDLIGKPFVSYDTGEKFDVIKDLIFDQDSNQLLGFVVNESSWLHSAEVLLLKDVKAIGSDAISTASKNVVAKANQVPAIPSVTGYRTIAQLGLQ